MGEWLTQKVAYFGENNPKWRGGKTTFVCNYCSKEVEKYQCQVKGKRFFCSKTCFDKYRIKPKWRLPLAEMHHEKHPRWCGQKFCKACGTELRERLARRRGYRSDECCNSKRFIRKSGAEHHGWFHHVRKFCKKCGKEITRPNGRMSAKFCNRECQGLWNSENKSGRNSPLWKEHKAHDDYPPEWNGALRHSIRVRDGFRCMACGFKKERLEIHHIDLNKMNCHESNLITLCSSCHRAIHNVLRAELKRLKENHDLY